jgi:hypothetical protein
MSSAAEPVPPTNATVPRRGGTWLQRFFIGVFSVLLGLLTYWLLGFVVNDLGSLPGPDYQQLEQQRLDPQLLDRQRALESSVADTRRSLENEQNRQRLLRESTASSQMTLNQMLEIQRLSIQQQSQLTPDQQQALSDSQKLFLDNQVRDQQLTESIAALDEQLRGLAEDQRQNDLALDTARQPIRQEFDELLRGHNWRMAALKLAFLTPLLLISAVLFVRRRHSIWAPMIYASGLAVLAKTFAVMHEHFPARYFKYILILSCLAAVIATLYYLLRALTRPGREALLKQYRERYEAFLCPICRFPIRRGPLKYAVWTRWSIRGSSGAAEPAADDAPYTCPACATPLYEKCSSCGQTRYALLPACEHCGAVQAVPQRV